jgi:hypothetical protein
VINAWKYSFFLFLRWLILPFSVRRSSRRSFSLGTFLFLLFSLRYYVFLGRKFIFDVITYQVINLSFSNLIFHILIWIIVSIRHEQSSEGMVSLVRCWIYSFKFFLLNRIKLKTFFTKIKIKAIVALISNTLNGHFLASITFNVFFNILPWLDYELDLMFISMATYF